MDATTIEAALGRIGEGLQEAHTAVELLREGDVTAMAELDAVVDAIAREVAELKTHTGRSPL
jgi:hypothetical protein